MQVQQALVVSWSEVMYVCMYLCMYVCTYMYLHMYICTYICMCARNRFMVEVYKFYVSLCFPLCTLCNQDNDKDKGHLLRQLTYCMGKTIRETTGDLCASS